MPELTVCSYNAHGCRGMDGRHDPRRVADVLARTGADVVAVQEVERNRRAATDFADQPALLADALEAEYAYGVALSADPSDPSGDPREYGILLLSVHPFVDVETHRLTRHEDTERRVLLRARLDVDGESLVVCNTHFGLATEVRREQARDVLALTDDERTVLLGDLNATPDSAAVSTLTDRFTDAFAACGMDDDPTFPTPYVESDAGDLDGVREVYVPHQRIDYALCTPDVAVRGAEKRESLASDHSAVVAHLGL